MTKHPDQAMTQSDNVTSPLIAFRNVGKQFIVKGEPLQAVHGIDLDVYEGEILTLVGPSGCGKSTLLNMAAGLFAPTEGEVFYRGSQVQPYNPAVGYMTQSDHLLPWRDVIGNIAIPLEIKGLSKSEISRRVEELMETVGLGGFGKSYPNQLSGGMRKRCALARLLAYDPETLLMDEPFAALDALLRMRMQIEIRDLCRRLNKTVMFVTHDLDEAVAIGDRCAVFTGRPGSIERIVDVPLAPDRNILHLRKDPDYRAITADLWEVLAPSIEQEL
ncbi:MULTISPECIES: ABC transporter ATP-binding protein [Marivita]|jgi:NitT/TauT family transport system ATP-binding protein|uniref:ABC transporter ATP-binding protein n=1 Tax=Marivita cryptomonadis TaxID=505252 RepID=A0A9Q2S1N2_9RHOB|nr:MULTISPECIES: ABC transporter ATP-binding protein [Marivita]MCR9168352.1 ABC transporter ATP-binding protein [Paracoccaceae bacterium]MBM2323687.1 ABC transporter ATP-binding protein [Marivita cryptomonadis]MBM2333275.1 ABC transporter ATP-binding protein [Marivita cryptomonadis]MBM2342853.1 ABC transporter ATP-binding protein [Marivita cryptomonadis]MBM2347523.1 ABC transporter ATP-binding protein [Marivita cryptomonadis]